MLQRTQLEPTQTLDDLSRTLLSTLQSFGAKSLSVEKLKCGQSEYDRAVKEA
jgi:hypothetical protein